MLALLSPTLSSIAMEAREKTLNCRVIELASTPPCLLQAGSDSPRPAPAGEMDRERGT